MKAIYKYAIVILSSLALVACGDEKDEPTPVDPNQKEEVQPVTKTLTFVLPENSISGKTQWVAGDEIVVHGEYAADQVTVKLSAGDISADGKTASLSVDNLKPYVREDVTSTLYAGYPASAVNNLRHCFFYTQFNTTNSPLMAACNGKGNDTFQFVDLSAAISFTVDDKYDGYVISGNKKETLGYGVFQVKITPEEQNYIQYVNDPLLSIEGSLEPGLNTIYVPGNVQLEAGYTIKFKEGEEFTGILKTHDEASLSHGEILDLGDISTTIEHYVNPFSSDVKDLDTGGNANCYIVTAPGTYKFKAVYGNKSTSFLMDVADAVVLWETWNDDQEVEAGSVLAAASYAEDYIILTMPETLHPGNAVVAARAEDGTILWCWHIWVPQTEVTSASYGGIMGTDVMDRNLGALVVTEAGETPIDPLSYGLVYQWGRKDPFTGPGTFNGKKATWVGVDEEIAPGQITVADAVAQPRLLGHINDGDWSDQVDETLWQDEGKTIYDPCPVGYRVPPRNSNVPFWTSDLSAQTGWAVDATNGWLTIGDPVAVFPIAGYRDDYSVGDMAKVGARTLYWTAHGSEAKAACADLRYDKGTFMLGSAPKARLGSVRCVAEE